MYILYYTPFIHFVNNKIPDFIPEAAAIIICYWIRTKEFRFKNHQKSIKTSILTENFSKKLNSNSLKGRKVLKLTTLLEDRNVNITSQFVRIFKVFEDFRFISQLREEMDKVRPAVAIVSPPIA